MDSDLPAQIGRYQVLATLGRGAMGVVCRAHDPLIERDVALKLLHRDLLGDDGGQGPLALLQSEARAAGRCQHPNIAALFDIGLHQDMPFLVMEYVDGPDLGARLRQRGGALLPGEAVAIGLQVLAALGAAHAAGIIHRDIKPSNVLLSADGHAKVSDFGISSFKSAPVADGAGLAGTPSYMSPEQCRGEAVDERSDLFSVGVLLYEMLCGRRPFPGRSPQSILRAVVGQPPQDFTDGNAVPPALQGVVRQALSKAPEQRHASAAAMAAALRQALQGATGIPQVQPRISGEPTLQGLQRVLARYFGPLATHRTRQGHGTEAAATLVSGLTPALAGSAATARLPIPDLATPPLPDRAAVPSPDQPGTDAARLEKAATALEIPLLLPPAPDPVARVMVGALPSPATPSQVSPPGLPAGTASSSRPEETEHPAAATAPSPGPAMRAAGLERLRCALAEQIGPIANLLVRRAATGDATLTMLWEQMATQIDDPTSRERFLREGWRGHYSLGV